MTASQFVGLIKQTLTAHASPKDAVPMSAYMKNKFLFLGIKKPLRAELTHSHIKEFVKSHPNECFNAAKLLWDEDEREYQSVALDLFDYHKKNLKEEDLDAIEWFITNKSWWDTVDMIATKIAGTYFKKYPHKINESIKSWGTSDNIWLVRSALLFQLKYKDKTDINLLSSLILAHADKKEFFIAKAIGWTLREYAKTDAEFVRDFVANNNLQKLSQREALKHIQ